MIATYDKVIPLKDDKDALKAIIVHDLKSRHQVHYTVNEMGADEILALYGGREVEKEIVGKDI